MTTFQNPSSDKNIEIIKKFYTELNQNNLEAALALFDANMIRREFEDSPNGGIFRGLTEFRKNLEGGRSTWAEGSCQPLDFKSHGNKTVVTVHVKVRVKNNPQWIDAQVSDGFALQGGRLTEFHSFTSPEKAFEWAGISYSK